MASLRKVVAVSIVVAIPLMMSGCSSSGVSAEKGHWSASTESSYAPIPKIHLDTTAKSLNNVMPLDTISISSTVSAPNVTITNTATGKTIKGNIDDKTWRNAEHFTYDTHYHVEAESEGVAKEWEFYVPKPITAEPVISPMEGTTVGVGSTVAVRFDVPIPDRKKAEESIVVKTTPQVEGKFHWVNDSEVRWRPQHFWREGTQVSVDMQGYGKNYGGDIYGGENTHTSFTIGTPIITTIDNNTKKAVVKKNGKVIKTFPVSLGSDANPTNPGIYILGDHNESMVMDSSTYGVAVDSADGYRLNVDYATQMSYSGIYLHSAPWAVGAIGAYNQSHGCVNARPEDAKWFLENTKRGDVVIVKNVDAPTLPVDDGLGDWNTPWSEW